MDYEKKYKEALEKMREKMGVFDEATISREDVEEIFPEFAENGDNEIINQIIYFINHPHVLLKDNEKEKWVKWLLKQSKRKYTCPKEDESYLTNGMVDNISKEKTDELIRETLIAYHMSTESINGIHRDDIIKWLKNAKQNKERKQSINWLQVLS